MDLVQGTFDKSGNSEAEGIWGHLGSAFLVSPVFVQIQKPVVKTDMEQLAQELEELAQAQVRREKGPVSQTAIRKEIWAGGTRDVGIGEGRDRCWRLRAPPMDAQAFYPTLGLEGSAASVLIQALLPVCCVALGKSFHISRPLSQSPI